MGADRDESEHERLDRNLIELLQELRVAQAGVQILFAFLLTLPFTQRFDQVSSFQRGVYLLAVVFTTAASIFLIGPVAYHRLLFRRDEKRRLVFDANKLALAGLTCLAAAMLCAVFLVVDVLFGTLTVAITVGGAGTLFVAVWLVLPLVRATDESRQ
jgi:predicted neutral ceramidase superfamily lipid hydrolase